MLHEAMDAGACGWSAQRLKPDGPSAVQRDCDGTPMVTDVMHDETCLEWPRVLGERGEGFLEMTLVELAIRRQDARPLRGARRGQRPPDHVRGGADAATASRIAIATRSKWLERCRQRGSAGLRPGHHHRRRADLHVRGLEPVRRLRRVARGHDRHRGGAQARSWAIPRRRQALKSQTAAREPRSRATSTRSSSRDVDAGREQASRRADAARGRRARPASIRST